MIVALQLNLLQSVLKLLISILTIDIRGKDRRLLRSVRMRIQAVKKSWDIFGKHTVSFNIALITPSHIL